MTKRGSDLSTRSSCQEKGSRRVIGTKRHLFCTNQSVKRDKYKKERTNITNQSVKRTKLERYWVLGGEVGSEKWKCWENILLSFHSPPEKDRLTDTHRKDKQKIFKIQFCEKWKWLEEEKASDILLFAAFKGAVRSGWLASNMEEDLNYDGEEVACIITTVKHFCLCLCHLKLKWSHSTQD